MSKDLQNVSAHSLPVVLVSAADETAAKHIISEIIECSPSHDAVEASSCGSTWRISNKYYTRDVHLHALPDAAPLPADLRLAGVDAHLIYLQHDECLPVVAERRSARVKSALMEDAELVALSEAADASPELAAWAVHARCELVPLLEQPGPDDDAEPRGLQRARAALHAHRWSGPAVELEDEWDELGEPDVDGEEDEPDVERFAAALRLAAEAREERGAGGERAARLQRAEALVSALALALPPALRRQL